MGNRWVAPTNTLKLEFNVAWCVFWFSNVCRDEYFQLWPLPHVDCILKLPFGFSGHLRNRFIFWKSSIIFDAEEAYFTPSHNLYSINLCNFQTMSNFENTLWKLILLILYWLDNPGFATQFGKRIVLAKQWTWRILCCWVPTHRNRLRACLHGGGGPQMGDLTNMIK